jgi:hypothetical protein
MNGRMILTDVRDVYANKRAEVFPPWSRPVIGRVTGASLSNWWYGACCCNGAGR